QEPIVGRVVNTVRDAYGSRARRTHRAPGRAADERKCVDRVVASSTGEHSVAWGVEHREVPGPGGDGASRGAQGAPRSAARARERVYSGATRPPNITTRCRGAS